MATSMHFPNSDTNALTVTAPDLLIYAALTYAADYYLDERAGIFEQKFLFSQKYKRKLTTKS